MIGLALSLIPGLAGVGGKLAKHLIPIVLGAMLIVGLVVVKLVSDHRHDKAVTAAAEAVCDSDRLQAEVSALRTAVSERDQIIKQRDARLESVDENSRVMETELKDLRDAERRKAQTADAPADSSRWIADDDGWLRGWQRGRKGGVNPR